MLDLFFLPIVIAFLWPTTNIKDTKNGEILTGVIPTLLFSSNAFINPLLYAFGAKKFQQAINIRFDTICLRKCRAGSWSNSYSIPQLPRQSALVRWRPCLYRNQVAWARRTRKHAFSPRIYKNVFFLPPFCTTASLLPAQAYVQGGGGGGSAHAHKVKLSF